MARYKFEDCRVGALEHLDYATARPRHVDAPATKRQQTLVREATVLIGQAKAKPDEAARTAR